MSSQTLNFSTQLFYHKTHEYVLPQQFIWICTFLVRTLGCWKQVLGDRSIPAYPGVFGIHKCYEKAKSLGNRVFSVLAGRKCYTSSNAGDVYKKYGPDTNCAIEVYEIENGNQIYS